MKKLNKLLIILLFAFGFLGLIGCEGTTSNGIPAPKPENVRIEETTIRWDHPEGFDDLAYEITFVYEEETIEVVRIGKSYNFSKYAQQDEITFSIKTAPFGEYGASSEEVLVKYTKASEPVHTHEFVNGKCECGEIDPNYEAPHTHEFVNGKCECGETDPNYEAPVAPVIKSLEITSPALGLGNYADGSATVDDVDFSFIELGDYGNGIQLRNKSKTSTLWNTTAVKGNITKIEFVYNAEKATFTNPDALKIEFGTDSSVSGYQAYLSTQAEQTNYTITPDKVAYTYVKFTINITYSMYFDSIKIYYESGEVAPVVPHEHEFINGKCSCGETDPNYEQPVIPDDGSDVHEDGYVIKVQTGVPYILKLEHLGLNETLYITGAMDGYYYQTTTTLAESIVIYLEETDGGYYVYHLKNDAKVYLDIVPSGTHINVVYVSTPGDAWKFDTTVNTLTNPVDGTDYMLGTNSTKTYRTYSANKLSYASTTYIAYLFKADDLKNQPDQPVIPDTPVNPDDLEINNEEYYKNVLGLSGNALKLALRTLTTSTHKKASSYSDCKFELPFIDEDSSNTNNMILFYTGQSIKKSTDLTNDWNREHVWPQSLGWFKTSGAGSDLHHIRPCNISVNSSRGNKKFGTASGYYEPIDEYKGDVARIIFYLMVRYAEADNYNFNTVSQGIDLLLAWNELDPVSPLEMQRNNRVEDFQGNRNPFIDCADFADLIW